MRGDQQPETLAAARESMWRQRPSRDADPTEWIAFHRRSATAYAEMAKVDTGHRFEAMAYAGVEIRLAREIEHRLDPSLDDESLSG